MTINEILNQLPHNQKTALLYALEHGLEHHVEYSPGKFVGVNTDNIPGLLVNDRVGCWTSGVIKLPLHRP